MIGAIFWTAALSTLVGISLRETVLVFISGLIAAAAGTCGALVQSHRASAAREVLERAEHEANHDALTNLLNRNALIRQLDASIATARQNDTVVGVLVASVSAGASPTCGDATTSRLRRVDFSARRR